MWYNAPSIKKARLIIESHLDTMSGFADQIAFFGGSFTGIDKNRQNEYLALAEEYIKKGLVKSVRLSTRPDCIDDDTVLRLISFGVKNIELGAQSMDDNVLKRVNRGHSVKDVEKASEIIKKHGAVLGLQMMTGLPGDSAAGSLKTAIHFMKLGAEETRIYPTIVIKGTELDNMYKEGSYVPQTIEEAVSLCAELYTFFSKNGIKILRIGLPDSSELKNTYSSGPYHPSFGELVISRVYRNKIERMVGERKNLVLRANPKLISKIKGNKRCNIEYFKNKGIEISVITDKSETDCSVI